MKILFNKPLFLTTLVLVAVSCGSDEEIMEDTNDTFLDYLVVYDSDLDVTTVSAGFHNNNALGSDIILREDESITFGEDELVYDEGLAEYVRTYPGKIETGDFVFTSSEGKKYINSLTSYESIDFPSDFNSFSKNVDLTVSWVGASLEEFGAIEVGIGDPSQGSWAGDVFEGEGITSFTLRAQNMTTLDPGMWLAYIIRINRLSFHTAFGDNTTRAGGRLVTKYRSSVQVEVVE